MMVNCSKLGWHVSGKNNQLLDQRYIYFILSCSHLALYNTMIRLKERQLRFNVFVIFIKLHFCFHRSNYRINSLFSIPFNFYHTF
jgi:hypothetical protein